LEKTGCSEWSTGCNRMLSSTEPPSRSSADGAAWDDSFLVSGIS
jgi:hypothetical protein